MLQSSRLWKRRKLPVDGTWQRNASCVRLSLCFYHGNPTASTGTRREVFIYPRLVSDRQRRHGAEIGPTLNRETRARAWSKMMNFEFKCPQCGQMVEADEAYRGQVAECPHCGKGIVIPCNRTKGVIGRKRSSIHQQDHHYSTAESAMASTLLGTESPLQPTVISDKWVWCLSVIPIVAYWTLCILVHSFVGLLVAWILNVIFVILDFKEVDRSGQDVSKALYLWGLFFVPGYLFYLAVK